METMATLNSGEDFIDDLHFFPPFALGGKIKLVKPCSCYKCWYWQLPDGSRRYYSDYVDVYAIAYDDYIAAEELINFRCPECQKKAIARISHL